MSEQHARYEYDFDPGDPNNTAAAVYRMARAGGNRVLDLGSGPGIVSSRLKSEDGRSVTCVDNDVERLAVARSRGVDRTILADLDDDAWADELAGEQFDVVILADVLEHLVDPGRVLDLIRRRILAAEGCVVVSIPNASHEAIIGELITGNFTYREAGLLDTTHIRFFTRASFERFARTCGFAVAELGRTRLALDETEMSSRAADLPVAVRLEIRRSNPESTTYQFVARLEASPPGPDAGRGPARSSGHEAGGRVVDELADAVEGATTVLAVGAGAAGAAARLVETRGARVVYIDSDPSAADRAIGWGALRTLLASLDDGSWVDLVAGERFDAIILGDILERCAQPRAILRKISDHGLLAQGGAIAADVANMSSWPAIATFFAPDETSTHGLIGTDRLRFFTRRSVTDLFEGEGFSVRGIRGSNAATPSHAVPEHIRRHLEAGPDAASARLVIRAEPAGEADEFRRLVARVEELEAQQSRLLLEIAAERRSFNAYQAASVEARQTLHVKMERLRREGMAQHDLAVARRRELERIRRSPAWRWAKRLSAIARFPRDPMSAIRRLRRRTRSSSTGAPDSATSAPEVPATDAPRNGAQTPPIQAPPMQASAPDLPGAGLQEPRLSIVIPVYNGFDVTRRCLESIYAARIGVGFEVVVVDNASSDGVSDWLAGRREAWPSMQLISNETNRGFGGGVNQGVDAARGDHILICNSDVIIPAGSLERLVRTLDEHPEIGIVSPITNYVGEGPQLDTEAKEATPDTVAEHAARIAVRGAPLMFVPDRLVFFCVLVRKSLFDLLGGLPGAYGLGNFEDDDFCVRARMAGYRLAIDPNVFVFHHGSVSWKKTDVSHTDWMRRNRPIFFERMAEFSTTLVPGDRPTIHHPEATVILRTVDRPVLLRQALISLTNQTYRRFEVVVVNDAGPRIDDLLAEFDPYLTIRYVHHPEPRGRAGALNSGIVAARGEWVTYLDDDDILYPMHLDVLVDAVRESGFRVAYSDVNRLLSFVDDEKRTSALRETLRGFDFNPNDLLVSNRMPIQSIIHAAACVPAVGGFDESLNVLEDWEFMIRLSRRFPFYHAKRVTSEYRFRVSSDTENTIVSRRDEVLATQREIYLRYPVSDERLEKARAQHVHDLEAQIAEIQRLRGSSLPDSVRAVEIANAVLQFRSSPVAAEREPAAAAAVPSDTPATEGSGPERGSP